MDLTHKIISDYSYYLRIERALSPNTVEAYTSDLDNFFSHVAAEPSTVSTQDILDYLAENARLSKRSQSRLLSSFRSFFDWLVMEGDRKDNPCDGTCESNRTGTGQGLCKGGPDLFHRS